MIIEKKNYNLAYCKVDSLNFKLNSEITKLILLSIVYSGSGKKFKLVFENKQRFKLSL